MIVYIAGAITSDPRHAYRFADAEMVLAACGHVPLNPCMLPDGMEYEQYMRIDQQMIREADAVCLLDGWRDSPGARRDVVFANELGKQVFFYKDLKARVTW